MAKVAILAGNLMLLTRRIKPGTGLSRNRLVPAGHVQRAVHRGRSAGKERTGWINSALPYSPCVTGELRACSSFVTAALSNLVSNVPAVLVLKPFVEQITRPPQHAWLVVAMASTLAGNFTILGSVANLIVVQRAHRAPSGYRFLDLLQGGRPAGLFLTILVGVLWV